MYALLLTKQRMMFTSFQMLKKRNLYDITKSMEQSLMLIIALMVKEYSTFYGNRIHDRIQNSPPLNPIQGQMMSVDNSAPLPSR
jgi:hypothetical protein